MNNTNPVLDTIMSRYSCRNFKEEEIDDEVLNDILDAGLSSPTGGDLQMFSIIKVTDQEKKDVLAELNGGFSYVKKAPVSLLFCIDMRRAMRISEVEFCPVENKNKFMEFMLSFADVMICAQTICIAAESVGLKSIYIGNQVGFISQVSEAFELPKYVVPILTLCLGYPKKAGSTSKKYSRDVIVHENTYVDMPIEKLVKIHEERYNNFQKKVNEDLLKSFLEQCRKVEGEEFAAKAEKEIREKGYMGFYQYFLGIFYQAPEGECSNSEFKEYFEKQGFNWM